MAVFFALKTGVSSKRALQSIRRHISLCQKNAAKITSANAGAAEVKNTGGLMWTGLCWLSVSDEEISILPGADEDKM
ncbi:hypothetical protein [Pantoea sp. 9140]|uniref:hypothetical protein n=1 Tax=Pantoea sp. 9140 TaxID=1500896 RepID=UPI000AA375D4|nr:hypothetical protein [Pantoea sp. 9140]